MNTNNHYRVYSLILFFVSYFSGFTQTVYTSTSSTQSGPTITLTVDIETLLKNKDVYEDEVVVLSDGTQRETGDDLKEFEVYLGPGSESISWQGKSMNDSKAVNILKITRKPAFPRVYFRTKRLTEERSYTGTGAIQCFTKDDKEEEDFQRYSIKFEVEGGEKPFKIDPKLRVKGGGAVGISGGNP